jgi:hypothetical protein
MFKLTLNKEVTCYICIVHFVVEKVYLCNLFINFSRHSFIKHSLRSCQIKLVSKVPLINPVA